MLSVLIKHYGVFDLRVLCGGMDNLFGDDFEGFLRVVFRQGN